MGFKSVKNDFNRTGLIANFVSGKYEGFSAKNVAGPARSMVATGGALAEPGNGYKYHFFTSTSSPGFEVTRGNGTVDYLIIGGGGAGGSTPDYIGCGGGGAGGFLTGSVDVNPGSYAVVIGAGGAYQANKKGQPGLDSSIAFPTTLTASGGGGGGGRGNATNGGSEVGGSGGGASGYDNPLTGSAGSQYSPRSPLFPAPAPGQGNAGGNGQPTTYRTGGGGGGAGEPGSNSTTSAGGDGGDGSAAFNGDTGIPPSYGASHPNPLLTGRYFAGGGGGGYSNPPAPGPGGAGGVGGGGNGSSGAGSVNTGGGGGGANHQSSGGAGGSGIVIIRYQV